MRAFARIAPDVAFSTIVALVVVVSEMPLAVLVLLLWVPGAWWMVRRRTPGAPRSIEGQRILIHLSAMGAIIAIAAALPGKRVERLLDETVVLESAEMTLDELKEYCEWQAREQFPLRTYVEPGKANGELVVRFPDEVLTLRGFISAIESQTPLRHNIGGCGNAYTIIDGPAYNFGLSLSEPAAR